MNRWMAPIAATWLLAMTVTTVHAQGPGDAESDDAQGASALRQLASVQGHSTSLLTSRFEPPAGAGVLFVIEPENNFTPSEARTLQRWVARGGVLVYASANPDRELEDALGLVRTDVASGGAPDGVPGTPLLSGVERVRLGYVFPFDSTPQAQTAFLYTAGGDVAGIEGKVGVGQYLALASSSPLTNAAIGIDDNPVLAADLLAEAGPGAPVVFDQFHHGGGAGQASSLAWVGTPWGLAIVMELVTVFGLLVLAGRAFGPLIPLRPVTDPSSAEFTAAVGAMMRRAQARPQALGRLLLATRSAVSRRVGLREGEGLDEVLQRRAPDLAEALGRATRQCETASDEASFTRAAAELHDLAHPVLGGGAHPQPATTVRTRRR